METRFLKVVNEIEHVFTGLETNTAEAIEYAKRMLLFLKSNEIEKVYKWSDTS